MARWRLAGIDDAIRNLLDLAERFGAASAGPRLAVREAERALLQERLQQLAMQQEAHQATISLEMVRGMLTEMLDQMMALVLRHRIRMPASFPQLVRALVVTEGVCLGLDPEFSFREAAAKTGDMIVREWLSAAHIADELVGAIRELRRYGMRLPRQVSHLFAQALAGGLKGKVEYVGLERPMLRVNIMVNRLAFARIFPVM